jgi:hypothetical protein
MQFKINLRRILPRSSALIIALYSCLGDEEKRHQKGRMHSAVFNEVAIFLIDVAKLGNKFLISPSYLQIRQLEIAKFWLSSKNPTNVLPIPESSRVPVGGILLLYSHSNIHSHFMF